MRKKIEELTSKLARRMGLEITRYRPLRTADGRLAAALKANKIDTVLDVGANVGQFALSLRSNGYCGRIVSFEPISECYETLLRISEGDNLWTIAPRIALSNNDSTALLNVSSNSVSSSLLPMRPAHIEAEPSSKYESTQEVKTARLDSISSQYLTQGSRTFLKVDAQGAEGMIIEGGKETISRVLGIKIEISLVSLYAGTPDGLEIINQIRAMGFELWGLDTGFVDPRTGRTLQMDAIFFRGS